MKSRPDALERLDSFIGQRTAVMLVAILLLATLMRFWGLGYGLPYLLRADEGDYVIIVQQILKTGDLNPHFFNYPSMFIYANVLAYLPYFLVGKLAGVFQTLADIPAPSLLTIAVGYTTMPTTILLGRLVTLCFGVGTVAMVFFVNQQLTGDPALALLAAFLGAISPTCVLRSRFIKPDAFLTFFALLSFWAAVKLFQEGRTWQYLLAGLAGGLAASSKYNGVLILVTPVVAHFLRHGPKGIADVRLYLAGAASVAGFLLITPYALLDWPAFIADVRFEATHYATGHVGMDGDTVRWYLSYLWRTEGPLILFGVVEALRGVYRRSRPAILLSVFPVVYFVFVNRFVVRNPQTILPIVPFLLSLAASFVVRLVRQGDGSENGRLRFLGLALGALLVVSVLLPAYRTVDEAIRLSSRDSRETAAEWIAANLPPGSKIALEARGPYCDPQRFSVEPVDMSAHPPEWYRMNGFDYLVFSEFTYRLYYREPDRYADRIVRYEELFETLELVQIFSDSEQEVRIYAVSEQDDATTY